MMHMGEVLNGQRNGQNSRTTQYLLRRGLDVSLIRHQVIADNIANVDVPNFKRTEVSFESAMRDALEKNKQHEMPAALTDTKHIAFNRPVDITSVAPRLHYDWTTSQRQDGNNVDVEREMADATKNVLQYRAMADMISHNFKMMQIVMR